MGCYTNSITVPSLHPAAPIVLATVATGTVGEDIYFALKGISSTIQEMQSVL